MRVHINYIYFFLIFLSLFGLGKDQFVSRTNVKSIKETEWIVKPNSNSKVSKCISFYLLSFVVCSNLISQLWKKEFCDSYDRKLMVRFLIQTRLYRNIDIVNMISSKRYITKLFKDDYHFSYRRTELIGQFCSISGIHHQVENYLWKHLLNREWIDQKRISNGKEKEDLKGCLSGFI